MFANPAVSWYSNHSKSPREYGGGVVCHECWCITRDPLVQYACGIVLRR